MTLKTYAVTARFGRWIASWPLGRLGIGGDELAVWIWPQRPARRRTAGKESVELVRLRTRYLRTFMEIEDVERVFRGVTIEIPHNVKGIIKRLTDCGYTVADNR